MRLLNRRLSLCSKINADLRILTCWLNANKISLNSSKTEFILFRSRSKSLTFIPFLKLLGKRIYPSSSVKYLGVRIDEHLSWKPHIFETANKLRRANGALSKLRLYIPLKTLVGIYHAIFSSHMRYACQVWGLCDNVACHRILTLQKCALRLITFNAPRSPSNPIFFNLEILKFFDLVEVLNILFIHQHSNRDLPEDLLNTLNLSKTSHSFNTRGSTLGLLQLSSVKTKFYGLNSFSRLSIQQWNRLQRSFSEINLCEISESNLKHLARKFYLKAYVA